MTTQFNSQEERLEITQETNYIVSTTMQGHKDFFGIAPLDKEIIQFLIFLNKQGIFTINSCSGHNDAEAYIQLDIVKSKSDRVILLENVLQANLYKKDIIISRTREKITYHFILNQRTKCRRTLEPLNSMTTAGYWEWLLHLCKKEFEVKERG